MAREPFQILAIPWKFENEEYRFGVFKRSDLNTWQFVAGGGENSETAVQTVIREIKEELGIAIKENVITKLDSVGTIPKINFENHENWQDIFVVPEYAFAFEILDSNEIILAEEHSEYYFGNYQ
ncbi:dATP pyrophosphohydrolase [Enterococcus sp. PF1-24]|uniref:NUDIX domain-containing protein n=1 Tax=unclassified Enterococcus TaxID=2608891 RepID=UPI0024757FD7|nr:MULTISPECIES: NUDIX domain-containing protein [unclassified Enterococcus]MDH6365276.1 dATP pyrophosphohydrolase [Enterococcus sp. PFB1-1]MDH6402394.1 dATP pyrophosphohydrolase [Enterococcus sp. PF1-24]